MSLSKTFREEIAALGTDRQREYYDAYCRLGSCRLVAEKFGVGRRSVEKSIVALEKKVVAAGLIGSSKRGTFASICDELDRREHRVSAEHLVNSHTINVSDNDVIGVIGDMHVPFMHPMYLRFLADSFTAHGVTKVVNIGDLVDNHAISRHISEPDAIDPEQELDMTRLCIEEISGVFPEVMLCRGNHDDIPTRQAKELGIPAAFIRNMREVFGVPATWVIKNDFMLNDVYYFHGVGSTGMHPAYNRAKAYGMSTVQGHVHSAGGANYLSNPNKLWFGLDTGCGIDIDRYAFRYGKSSPRRPILGCGIVRSSHEAYFIPMDAEVKYHRRRS